MNNVKNEEPDCNLCPTTLKFKFSSKLSGYESHSAVKPVYSNGMTKEQGAFNYPNPLQATACRYN